MSVDIGPKIGIEGEQKFRQELQQINQGVKTLASEAKAVEAAMRDETDAEKKSAAQKEILERQLLSQREKLAKLEEGLQKSAQKYGEADVKTQKWQQAVYDATAALADMEHKLNSTDGQVDEVSGSLEEAEEATSGWADVLKGSLLADAVKSGLGWIKDTVGDIASAAWDASKAGAAYADEILTQATVTGLSAETLQEYRYMADLVDVSVDTITGSLSKMTKNMASARDGTGDAAEAWAALNVPVTNVDGSLRKAEDVFNDTITALGKVKNETERDALAMQLMGRSAQDLNPLIQVGAGRLEELRKEARDTGYVLSGNALTALGKQQDAMDRLDKKTEGLSNRFASRLAPAVTKATDTMGETLDNPRVKRGLDVIADGVGALIDGAADLASRVLPDLFSVFSFGDEQLRLFSDNQIALAASIDETKQAHQEMIDGYKGNAQGIVEETKRTEGLWKELQTLVGENGEVKKKDEERVNYISNELKEALGIQLELEGGVLQGYKDQQTEIDKLIKKREAEALLAAGAEAFADAEAKRNKALEDAAKMAPEVEAAMEKLGRKSQEYAKAREQMLNLDPTKYGKPEWEAAGRKVRELEKEVKEARETYQALADKYGEARSEAQGYFAEVDRWQRAQTAAANGNYEEVVRLLTDEFGVTLDYYRNKRQLNEQDKKDLRDKIKDQELTIAEYKRNLEAGLTGFSEAGLEELQSYVDEAKRILDGKTVGEQFLEGLVKGLKDSQKLREVQNAASAAGTAVKVSTKNTMQIASPSKYAIWLGKMWDEGLIEGMERREAELRRAAASVSGALMESGTGAFGAVGSYSTPAITSPIGYYGGSTNAYTTNLGGIHISIPGGGALNEEVLARQVSARIAEELQQITRGGRA